MNVKKWLVPVLAALVVILLGVVVFLLPRLNKPAEVKPILAAEGNVITASDEAELELQQQIDQEIANGKAVSLSYQRPFTLKDGKVTGYIANPDDNHFPMYFTITVDDKEFIHTGLVEVGARMETFEPLFQPEIGTYEGVLIYHGVDGETQELATESPGVVVDVYVKD